ncbi:hypothetical protein Q9L58_007451 [Maublancomyces gigas]|uniref:Cutinase n=1 Tax=Discina gigas TaxID=1032678 RepID=A0ABR3GD42_9PEZI
MKQTIFTVLALAAFASASPLLDTRADCAPVHIIAARATGEPPGPGIIGTLIDAVKHYSSQYITTDFVEYPATLLNYADSSAAGTAALKAQLTNQVAACPSQKIVLVGYSQGAHVVGDTLGGGGGGPNLGPKTAAVPASVSSHVTAVVLMGDPRHIIPETFQQGTATSQGMFPRLPDQSLEAFASQIHSYCDWTDLFCAGGLNLLIHVSYTVKYNYVAAPFILSKIGG